MNDQIYRFLSHTPPFSELPEKELLQVAAEMSVENYPKDTILSVQGKTKLEKIYIIKEGTLELFYETGGEKELIGLIKPGEILGGICILMNDGNMIRTLRVVDDATLYTLPREEFMEICTRHSFLYEYFAANFRKRMSDETFLWCR